MQINLTAKDKQDLHILHRSLRDGRSREEENEFIR